MKVIFASLCALVFGTAAAAHSPLTSSDPANGDTRVVAPSELALSFNGGMRLTRVTVAVNGDAEADLPLGGHAGFLTDYVIPFSPAGAGRYEIIWRGLSDDGHPTKGSLTFTVSE